MQTLISSIENWQDNFCPKVGGGCAKNKALILAKQLLTQKINPTLVLEITNLTLSELDELEIECLDNNIH
jgi:hypothetical protein